MAPIDMPRPTAIKPLSKLRPARTPTIEKPSMVSSKSSGTPKASTNGRAIRIKNVSRTAPNRPPNNDETNAAASARAACPFLDSGNPSRTVAWEADEPGIPSNTEAKVSDVGMTATRPTIRDNPETGSMPYIKGNTNDSPAIPPRPGNTPTLKPSSTPPIR